MYKSTPSEHNAWAWIVGIFDVLDNCVHNSLWSIEVLHADMDRIQNHLQAHCMVANEAPCQTFSFMPFYDK